MPATPVPDGHHLSDWRAWSLNVTCGGCGWIVVLGIEHHLTRHRDRLLCELPPRLRCKRCQGRPAKVVVTDNTRGKSYGPTRSFLVEGAAITPLPAED